jgi:hypothetical protein
MTMIVWVLVFGLHYNFLYAFEFLEHFPAFYARLTLARL